MNPSEIKNVLASLGAKPNKKLGQHFLIDRATLDTVVDAADIHAGDRVLEIGPGLGVLTGRLLGAGASVTAIEQDRLFIPYLERQFSGQPFSVIHGDAASLDWEDLMRSSKHNPRLGSSSVSGQAGEALKTWKFVSNLPYSITSLALRKALWSLHPAARVVVLVQREVAERAVAKSGKTSLLSLMIALASSNARIVRRVPAGAFFPPPRVESAVLDITVLSPNAREAQWGIAPERIMEIAKVGFAHPRKHLASNLATAARPKIAVQDVLRALSLNPLARAEDLSPMQWAALVQ